MRHLCTGLVCVGQSFTASFGSWLFRVAAEVMVEKLLVIWRRQKPTNTKSEGEIIAVCLLRLADD